MSGKGGNKKNPDTVKSQADMSAEFRNEKRYPCVGITLLYSPLRESSVVNLAEHLFKAAVHDMSLSGLAFEIDIEMKEGDKLVVLMQQPNGGFSARLMSEVRWCRKLAPEHYCVGAVIDAGEPVTLDRPGKDISDPVGKSIVPCELHVVCPACREMADFTYAGEQPVLAGLGIMPLYNCSECGTTRSLTGIILGQTTVSKPKP